MSDIVERASRALFSASVDVLAGYVSPLVIEVKRIRVRMNAAESEVDQLRSRVGAVRAIAYGIELAAEDTNNPYPHFKPSQVASLIRHALDGNAE